MNPVAAFVLAGLGGTLAAQTYVVDAAGGPGSSFTSIATAVAAVPDGAVLIVRAGSYGSFQIAGKGLTIVGEPGAQVYTIAATITISGTSAQQRVVVRDLAMRDQLGFGQHIVCTACLGPLLLQRVPMDTYYGGLPRQLAVQQCAQVVVDHCGPFLGDSGTTPATPAISVTGSDVVLCACDTEQISLPSVWVTNGSLQVVGGSLTSVLSPTGTIALTASSLRLAAASTVSSFAPQAITGTGTVRLDPGVVLVGAIASSLAVTVAVQPAVIGSGGAVGTTALATMTGAPGHLGALFAGPLANAFAVPGIQDLLCIAPATAVPMAIGVFGAPLGASIAVPASPLLLGSVYAWQGVTFDPSVGFAASNPSVFAP